MQVTKHGGQSSMAIVAAATADGVNKQENNSRCTDSRTDTK